MGTARRSAGTDRPRRRARGRMRRRLRLDGAVAAGDVALGAGVLAAAPAVRMSQKLFGDLGTFTTSAGGSAYAMLPDRTRDRLRRRTAELADSGRQARTQAVEGVVSTVVAEVLASEAVRTALATAVEGVVVEVVPNSVPNPVDRIRTEIVPSNLDDAVRASIERVLPQVLEKDLTEAFMQAATLPARTARGLARLPSAMTGGRSQAAPEESS